MDNGEFFVSGLILIAIAGNGILKRFIPEPLKKSQKIAVLREVVHTREIIREPSISSPGKTVMCPFCNKILQ